MPKLSLLIHLNAYSDPGASNAPSLSNFKWTRDMSGLPASNPISEAFSLASGESRTIFSGTRTLAQAIDTVYSIALKPLSSSTYRILNTSGTPPLFRTARNIGTDATTAVTAVVNGPIVAFSAPGTSALPAEFLGDVLGKTETTLWNAVTPGVAANTISIVGDGTSTFAQLMAAWNTANPSNQVTQVAGNSGQIPSSGASFTLSGGVDGVTASFSGQPAGFSSGIILAATNQGVVGNSILLTGDGATALVDLVAAWNTANPSNQVVIQSGDDSQVLTNAATIALANGVDSALASFVGNLATTIVGVELDAVTAGAAGNSILLTGNGSSSLAVLISTWNTANPSNTVSLSAGNGNQIPNNAVAMQLAAGVDASGSFNTANIVVGDYVRLGSMFNTLNQGEFKIIAKSANAFVVENFTGVNEGPIVLGSGFASQLRVYSAAGVQRGDTLVIDQGFSPVTFGSYKITDVTDNYIEFYSTDVLPQETTISSALNIYSQAKSLIYLEADQKCSVTVNGTVVANMEPFVINDSTQPGVFMLKSTVYSFEVQNNSLDPASCFVATVE